VPACLVPACLPSACLPACLPSACLVPACQPANLASRPSLLTSRALSQHTQAPLPLAAPAKAHALGSAMLLWLLLPWALATTAYSALHCTYPRDCRRRAAAVAQHIGRNDNL
jgi:hypothetical protein